MELELFFIRQIAAQQLKYFAFWDLNYHVVDNESTIHICSAYTHKCVWNTVLFISFPQKTKSGGKWGL